MPCADYAALPESGDAESGEVRSAERVLARLAGRLVLSRRVPVMIAVITFDAGMLAAGLGLRALSAPGGREAAVAWAVLLIVAVAGAAMDRRAPGKEPQWARAAAVHDQLTWALIPPDMRAMLHEFTRLMATGTRWQGGVHVYIARCTAGEGEVHYEPCCAGGTLVIGGRLLVILGEHLAAGPVPVARAVLARGRRQASGWRHYAYALASVAGPAGLMIAGLTVTPWPVMLLAAASLRAVRTAATWMIEISCDVGAALEAGPDAAAASVLLEARTEGRCRAAARPRGRRWALDLLTLLAGAHPPYTVRTAAIQALAREGAGTGRPAHG